MPSTDHVNTADYEEARRRIAHALESDAEMLDLGDLALEMLPPELAMLSKLRILALGRFRPSGNSNQLDWEYRSNSPCRLQELSVLRSLVGLKSLSIAGNRALTDVAPLAQLSNLTWLDCSGCSSVTDLAPLARSSNLISFNCSWCHSVTDLAPLARLSKLTSLNCSYCSSLTDLPPLAQLPNLTSLDCSFCISLTDLAPLAQLSNLTSLNCSWCRSVTDLAALARMSNLTSLDCSGCSNVTDLAPLAQLSNLTSLDCSGCSSVTDLAPLAQLSNLTSLYCSRCSVTDLAPLAQLSNLTSLYCSGCSSVTDLAPLAQLSNLTSLDCSRCSSVTDLAPLARLSNLTSLTCARCSSLTDLAPLAQLSNLTLLNISGCNQVNSFRSLFCLLEQLDYLILYKCHLDDIPIEICGESEVDNVIVAVRDHYADLQLGAKRDPELKIFVLGNGAVGKTQLCRRLRGEQFDSSIKTTHGIQLDYVNLELSGFSDPIRLNLWDFGGQDIYHGSHAMFLHGHAVFIIMWTPNRETGEIEENGLTIRNRPLPYWLDYVRGLAGTDSPVLVVQSQCDQSGMRVNAPQGDISDFHFPQTTAFSAQTDLGLETLQGMLTEAVRDVLDRQPPPLIGEGRIAVRDRIRTMVQEIQKSDSNTSVQRTLDKADFVQLCEETQKVRNPESLLEYLHRCGVLFYRRGLFNDQIILDQTWALAAIYTLFERNHVAPLLNSSGRFARPVLEALAWSQYSREEQRLFLSFMESCGICFRVDRSTDYQEEPEYIAPELLPEWSTARRQLFGRLTEQPPDCQAMATFRFLHEGILRGFLSRIGRQAGNAAVYWKYGCWFYEESTSTQVMIDSGLGNAPLEPGAGHIVLRAWGNNPRDLLEVLVQALLRIPMGQPPTVEWSQSRVEPTPLHLDGSGHTEDRQPLDKLVVSKHPDLQDRGPTQTFISYAWADINSAKASQLVPIVDQVCAKLKKWDYKYLRDNNELVPGQLISDFMKQIRRSDHVIVFLSDAYLHSPYCMAELHSIYDRANGDKADFLKRITMVLLPDARISHWRDRVAMAKYWRTEFEEMRQNLVDLGVEGTREYQSVVRWHAVVADMLAYLNDRLNPQTFDEIAANDFAILKQLLPPPNANGSL